MIIRLSNPSVSKRKSSYIERTFSRFPSQIDGVDLIPSLYYEVFPTTSFSQNISFELDQRTRFIDLFVYADLGWSWCRISNDQIGELLVDESRPYFSWDQDSPCFIRIGIPAELFVNLEISGIYYSYCLVKINQLSEVN